MEWLNYHHLFYFWRIAREGSLTRAAETLHVTHSTLSAQVKALEGFLGGALFERRGRSLVLTPVGEDVAAYADDIFRLGSELVEVARGKTGSRRVALRVGVLNAIPKSVAHALLAPAAQTPGYGPITIRQANFERLLAELVAGRLHLVLSDAPPPESAGVKVFAHPLGESRVLLFGTPALAAKHGRRFPSGLAGAPLLLPTEPSSLRRQIERWLAERHLKMTVEGEFDDGGMMRVFGLHGFGLFPVREALRAELEESSDTVQLGVLDGLVERYWVLSTERRVRHPAIVRLMARGREGLAARPPRAPKEPRRRRRAR